MINPKKNLELKSPCKINVHLKIKDPRPDGYHDLESIFLETAFGDTLNYQLTENQDESCEIIMNWKHEHDRKAFLQENLPLEKNSIYRAVAVFRNRTGFKQGVKISAEKRIPTGAGLGGGSSNAATTLKAMNTLAGTSLSVQHLKEMAEILGSDIPFFLYGGAAWVTGRGEDITPVDPPKGLSIVLVYPGFSSNTQEAYRLLDEVRAKKTKLSAEEKEKIEKDEKNTSGKTPEDLIKTLTEHPAEWRYENDFLSVFLEQGSEERKEAYRSTLEELKAAGADFTGLSGSGSSCFGIFADERKVKKAKFFQKNARVEITSTCIVCDRSLELM